MSANGLPRRGVDTGFCSAVLPCQASSGEPWGPDHRASTNLSPPSSRGSISYNYHVPAHTTLAPPPGTLPHWSGDLCVAKWPNRTPAV